MHKMDSRAEKRVNRYIHMKMQERETDRQREKQEIECLYRISVEDAYNKTRKIYKFFMSACSFFLFLIVYKKSPSFQVRLN